MSRPGQRARCLWDPLAEARNSVNRLTTSRSALSERNNPAHPRPRRHKKKKGKGPTRHLDPTTSSAAVKTRSRDRATGSRDAGFARVSCALQPGGNQVAPAASKPGSGVCADGAKSRRPPRTSPQRVSPGGTGSRGRERARAPEAGGSRGHSPALLLAHVWDLLLLPPCPRHHVLWLKRPLHGLRRGGHLADIPAGFTFPDSGDHPG